MNGLTTWYVRDAQGNIMAMYDNRDNAITWKEQHLYGSSRLGLWEPEIRPADSSGTQVWDIEGRKAYEVTNHLGNVMATISDKKLQHTTDGTTVDYYEADILSAQDYYPGGMIMPGRNFTAAGSEAYRYGFNGKENDNEVKSPGSGHQQDYGMRIYDPRIGRFLSTDPLSKDYPWYTPYQFAGNMPIVAIDLDGAEPLIPNDVANSPKLLEVYTQGLKSGFLKIIGASDINDATVLTTTLTRGKNAINFDGTKANNADKGFAIAGAVIPFVSGSLIKQGVKWGLKASEWAFHAGTKGAKVADAIVGGSSVLRTALERSGANMIGKEAHHIIPTQLLKQDQVVQDAVNAGFEFNGLKNGIGLNRYTKAGKIAGEAGEHANHPQYNIRVLNNISDWATDAKMKGTYSPENAKKFLEGLSKGLMKQIQKESIQEGKKINDLKF